MRLYRSNYSPCLRLVLCGTVARCAMLASRANTFFGFWGVAGFACLGWRSCICANSGCRMRASLPTILAGSFDLFFIRPVPMPQDWRAAVREETSAAVKSVAATSGGDGDGLGSRSVMGDGAGGGAGVQGVSSSSSSSSNRLGESDPGGGGVGIGCGARDKVRACKP